MLSKDRYIFLAGHGELLINGFCPNRSSPCPSIGAKFGLCARAKMPLKGDSAGWRSHKRFFGISPSLLSLRDSDV